ncbi:MAG TPA: putative metal-dependent hydrolase, partial [Gemmatimonadaceae bacterium]|nr:putative metal-dependent hydrolase [Gemmatimonadaceae bacterium]
HIETLAATPGLLADAVRGLTDAQLDTPYRPDGWTVRQVVHHVADSHMNAYIRVKLALTENAPPVKPYDENEWAKLPDSLVTPVAVSLTLLDALHDRWVRVMRALKPVEYARTVTHADHGAITVDFLLALYAWHGPHHVGHITSLRKRSGW